MEHWSVNIGVTIYINKALKRKLISTIFIAFFTSMFAADVCINKLSFDSQFSWTIANREGHVEYSSKDFTADSVFTMVLPDDQSFYWNMTIDSVAMQDTVLMTLSVNGAVVLAVPNSVGLGDQVTRFRTDAKSSVMKIVGGTNADIEDFPWQVFFSFGDYMCGGTIIADRWILTAAHCTQDDEGRPISTSEMAILVGTSYRTGSGGKWYTVKDYIVHENYDNEQLTNDIAVLELNEDIDYPNAEAISLIAANDVRNGATDPGVMATITGWGYTNPTTETLAYTLQQVELPIVSNNVADDVWGYLPETILPAGYRAGNKDACNGDSGGPLVVDVDGINKIAGIVSFGSGDCNTYGGYTRVSSYLDWIERNTDVVPQNQLALVVGDTAVCYGTTQSEYQVSSNGDFYEWNLAPAEAGELSFDNYNASIVWNTAYQGRAELSVRATIEGEQTDWRVIPISILTPTGILSFSQDTVICEGSYYAIELEAKGDGLIYDWYMNDEYIKTTTEGRWIFPYADTIMSAHYKCLVSGTCGEEMSPTMELVIRPITRIVAQSSLDVDVQQGGSTMLNFSAVGHQLSYQWYKDEQLLSGADKAYLNLEQVNARDIGLYYAVVNGMCQVDTSASVYVYVDDKSLLYNARIWPTVCTNSVNVAISTEFLFDTYIYDVNGVLMIEENDNLRQKCIDITNLPTGIYFVHVESKSLNEVFRFIKE